MKRLLKLLGGAALGGLGIAAILIFLWCAIFVSTGLFIILVGR